MKQNTHAKYYPDAKITCACGHSFIAGSTVPELKVDICSACHPYYTGEQRFVDVQGRVEMFEKRRAGAKVAPKPKKIARPQTQPVTPLSLKEMLKGRTATSAKGGLASGQK